MNTIHVECSECGKIANTFRKVEKQFGWRIINGIKVPQTKCKGCRVKLQRKRIRAGTQVNRV